MVITHNDIDSGLGQQFYSWLIRRTAVSRNNHGRSLRLGQDPLNQIL
jgi:hypothetical protein